MEKIRGGGGGGESADERRTKINEYDVPNDIRTLRRFSTKLRQKSFPL